MKVVHLKDYQTFSGEKMKKLNVFETQGFFVMCIALSQDKFKRLMPMAIRINCILF